MLLNSPKSVKKGKKMFFFCGLAKTVGFLTRDPNSTVGFFIWYPTICAEIINNFRYY